MKWICNAKPPALVEGETKQWYEQLTKNRIVGDPQPMPAIEQSLIDSSGRVQQIKTAPQSVEQLKAQGIVGIYEP